MDARGAAAGARLAPAFFFVSFVIWRRWHGRQGSPRVRERRPLGSFEALEPDTLRAMLGHMAMVRAFDERMFRGQRQGKTSFYMKCTGEEAT